MDVVQCAYLGRLEELKALIEVNIDDIDKADEYGDTPLHAASLKGRLSMVEYLLQKGANVNVTNKMGSTPLHKAAICQFEPIAMVKLLLKHGGDANIKNKAGLYPEMLCQDSKLKEIILNDCKIDLKVEVPKQLHGRIIGLMFLLFAHPHLKICYLKNFHSKFHVRDILLAWKYFIVHS
jgi:ankyrin repeat protein